MCLSAIIWANIKDVYYACTRTDAESIGFRDKISLARVLTDFVAQRLLLDPAYVNIQFVDMSAHDVAISGCVF